MMDTQLNDTNNQNSITVPPVVKPINKKTLGTSVITDQCLLPLPEIDGLEFRKRTYNLRMFKEQSS